MAKALPSRISAARKALRRPAIVIALVFMCCAACGPLQVQLINDATPTDIRIVTATAAISPTPSIVWFPPTATPLPLVTPTVVPTVDKLGKLGEAYLSDGFAAKAGWQTMRTTVGNITLSDMGELTFSMPGDKGTLVSYNRIAFYPSYYLSVDVTLSFCSFHQDGYGILFRVGDSEHFARVWINCLGQTRFERISGGKAAELSDWAANGKIRPGAPQKFTVGLRVEGEKVELYLNDAFQYEIEDVSTDAGGIALAAETAGAAPLTVSFSNLTIRRLE